MDMNEYQKLAMRTKKTMPFYYPVLKLSGEAGEVAEKYGKLVRDKNGEIDVAFRDDIVKELGDVLWYIASIADDLGVDLETVGERNITKLSDRQARGVLGGSGDNR